jgi:hypothetical protein
VKGLDDMERLLREAKPEPRPEFVEAIETQLLPERRRHRAPRLVAAGAMVAALGIVVTILGLLGASPARLGGDHPAKAKDDCRTVMVERVERRPYVAVGQGGDLRIRYRPERVRRPVCR